MPDKQQPLGVCDLCLGPILDTWYTSKGKPRLYCSRDCRNTANSRAGAGKISAAQRRMIADGTWQNPAKLSPPRPELVSAGVRRARQREVASGIWRNPALTPAARAKLSRPRKHSGALHSALEKLRQGVRTVDLSPEEQEAHLAYRADLREARREELNAGNRRRYRARQAKLTDEQREAQREKWRAANRRRSARTSPDR